MMWSDGGARPIGFLVMGVFWLILIGLIVWLVVRLVPGGGGSTSYGPGESPLEILDRRLARGEVDLETWQAQRAALVAVQRNGT
ncbi:MAG: SHOCT domain-containing protein [Dermatophilaceae bacterium]